MVAPGGVELVEPIWSWASSSAVPLCMAWRSRSAAPEALPPLDGLAVAVMVLAEVAKVGEARWWMAVVDSVGMALDDLVLIWRGRIVLDDEQLSDPRDTRAGRLERPWTAAAAAAGVAIVEASRRRARESPVEVWGRAGKLKYSSAGCEVMVIIS